MNQRIGILSFAHPHAEAYQATLKKIPGVELVGFSHENVEEGARFSREYDIRWFPEPAQLIAAGIDGVVICSETSKHLELVRMAAQARCDILCEKPIATSLTDGLAIEEVCRTNGVHFMTAFPMRFAPSTRSIRTMIRNGDLGSILAISGINHSEIPKRHRKWFVDEQFAGGGAVMDHTVHLADLCRWFLDAEPVEVYAEIGNLFSPEEVEVDTAGLILVQHSNGVHVSIDCSWSRPLGYPRWGHVKMDIVGDNGSLILDAFAQHLTLYSKGAPRDPEWVGFGPDPNQAMLEEFVCSVREKRSPSVTWQDGCQALRVALAARESAGKNQPVTLAPLQIQ